MKALILAAGRGSRLGDATADRPKCLVDVAGRTLLRRQTAALEAAGVDSIGVVAGWRAESFDGLGLTVFTNPRWHETTMVESLAAADAWLRAEPVIVGYGDIVYTAETVRRLIASPGDLVITYDPDWYALWRRRFERPLDDAETFTLDADGRLLDIGGRASDVEEIHGQYMGLLKLTPASWRVVRRVRAGDPEVAGLDMTGTLRHLVRRGLLSVRTTPVAGPWFEFDHPSDLAVAGDVLRKLDQESAQ